MEKYFASTNLVEVRVRESDGRSGREIVGHLAGRHVQQSRAVTVETLEDFSVIVLREGSLVCY